MHGHAIKVIEQVFLYTVLLSLGGGNCQSLTGVGSILSLSHHVYCISPLKDVYVLLFELTASNQVVNN